jgi:hypothetical protein
MKPFPWSRLVLLLSSAALWASITEVAGAAEWQSLLGNSPFGQTAASGPTTAPDELEFRGVVQEEGVYLINLFNPATKTSQWIPVQGRALGLEVRSYDASTDKVQVTQAGRVLTLSLKQAHVALVQAVSPTATPKKDNTDAIDDTGKDAARVMPAAFRNLRPEAQALVQEFRRRRAENAAADAANQPPRQPRKP